MKKKLFSLIFSVGIFLYFLLKFYNVQYKNTITILIIIVSYLYFRKDLKIKKHSYIFIIILLLILSLPNILMNYNNLNFLIRSEIVDGLVFSLISFILLNYYIYE